MAKSLSEISARMAGIGAWLEQEAGSRLANQRHLDRDSSESAYWHSGYHQALADVLRLISEKDEQVGTEYIPSLCLAAATDEGNFLSA